MELKYFHFKSRTGINLKENLKWVWPHSTHTFRGMLHQLSPATTSILYMNTASTHGMVSHMHTYTTLHPSYSHTHIIMYTYSINTCMTVYECTHTHSIPGLPSCQFCQSPTVDIPTVNKGQAALPPCRGHSTTHVQCWAHLSATVTTLTCTLVGGAV